jgi:hypothetical protein
MTIISVSASRSSRRNLRNKEMSQMRAEDLREFWGKLAKVVGVQELPEVVKQEFQ